MESTTSIIPDRENNANTGNTGNTLKNEDLKEIKNELQRWYSILTHEYSMWQAGDYMDSLLLTTEWVQTNSESENESENGSMNKI